MGFSLSSISPISGIGNATTELVSGGGPIDDLLRSFDDKVLGGDAADKALEAAALQSEAAGEARALFDPFRDVGVNLGLNQASFLTDPQQQFDFLQSNPIFQLALDNLNQQTSLSGRGRAGATDATQQFANNTLLAAQPLIQQQSQNIGDLLNLGFGATSNIGNLITGAGAAEAGGIVGASNAQTQGTNNLLNLLALLGGG